MKKLFDITLITCGSLLVITNVQSPINKHNQSVLATEKASIESIQQTASAITLKITAGSSNGLGILIAKSGQTDAVVTNKKQLLDLKAPSSNATERDWLDYGNLLLQSAQLEKAVAAFGRAIKLNPNYTAAYVLRGNAYFELKKYQSAIANFNQAIQLNPNNAGAYFIRGNAYLNLKKYQSAIANFNQAIQFNPNDAVAYFFRGNAYINLKDDRAAIADFNQAIQLNPELADAYYLRGIAYINLKDDRAAIADLQKAAQLSQQQGNKVLYQQTQELLQQAE